VYETALVDWHLTPEYINEHWTEELLTLMFVKRKVRFDRMRKSISKQTETSSPVKYAPVKSEAEFFAEKKIPYRRGKL
jgi:hypothetical protein